MGLQISELLLKKNDIIYMKFFSIIRVFILIIGLFGAYAGFNISASHMRGVESCPSIGFIPLCYVVFLGYLTIVLSMIWPRQYLFLLGWIPVFLIAAIGVVAEILSETPVCPRSENAIPQCYYSLAISLTTAILAFIYYRKN